ncbi:MAG: flagellar basal body protein [Burkholderiaceae bacterium]|nr:flagellar basal body protein [Burkholderiaceae bacterium]
MASIGSIGNSGMQAAQMRLGTAANNIANLNTPNFRRQEVAQQEAPNNAGTQATVQRASVPGNSPETDMVQQIQATYDFRANVQSIKAQDQALGSLLNVKA